MISNPNQHVGKLDNIFEKQKKSSGFENLVLRGLMLPGVT
jgi:hypothetical protein